MNLQACLARGIVPLTLMLFNANHTAAGAFQSGSSGGTKHQQLTVKVRNGRTGLPIWLASPYVYVGEIDSRRVEESHRKTTFWADAHVDVTSASPRKVIVWVDFIKRDCRLASSNGVMYAADFDLDLVLSKGVVAPNLCSSKTRSPEPGVLTIWVIPASFKELWDE